MRPEVSLLYGGQATRCGNRCRSTPAPRCRRESSAGGAPSRHARTRDRREGRGAQEGCRAREGGIIPIGKARCGITTTSGNYPAAVATTHRFLWNLVTTATVRPLPHRREVSLPQLTDGEARGAAMPCPSCRREATPTQPSTLVLAWYRCESCRGGASAPCTLSLGWRGVPAAAPHLCCCDSLVQRGPPSRAVVVHAVSVSNMFQPSGDSLFTASILRPQSAHRQLPARAAFRGS
jgi:hypothetical protein